MSRKSSSRKKRKSKFFSGLIIIFLSVIILTQTKDKLFAVVGTVLNNSSSSYDDYVSADGDVSGKSGKSNTGADNEVIEGNNSGYSNADDNIIEVIDNKDEYIEQENTEKRQLLMDTVYINDEGQKIITNPDDILVLVNKERNLKSDYKPNDLVIPNVSFSFEGEDQKKYLRKEAATALEELFKEGEKEEIILYAVSGYRSYGRQQALFNYRAERDGIEEANKLTAIPGQSEHQTGLAMDVSSKGVLLSLDEDFGQTIEGIWLKENAHRFGFIIRYLKDKTDITGYSYEPWHIRYVGKDVAKEIYENNITLEEYLGFEYGMEY